MGAGSSFFVALCFIKWQLCEHTESGNNHKFSLGHQDRGLTSEGCFEWLSCHVLDEDVRDDSLRVLAYLCPNAEHCIQLSKGWESETLQNEFTGMKSCR